MLKHIWTVLCKQSVIDQDSNNLSLHEVLEKISLEIKTADKSSELAIPIDFEVVSLWSKDQSEEFSGRYMLIIETPAGEKIGKTISNELIVAKNKKRIRTRLKIRGIVISQSGDYQFKIFLQEHKSEKLVAQVPLEIDVNFTSSEQS